MRNQIADSAPLAIAPEWPCTTRRTSGSAWYPGVEYLIAVFAGIPVKTGRVGTVAWREGLARWPAVALRYGSSSS